MPTYRNEVSSEDSDSLRAFSKISLSLVSLVSLCCLILSITVASSVVGKVLGSTENNTAKVSIGFFYLIIYFFYKNVKAQ